LSRPEINAPPAGATTPAIAENLNQPHHLSYIYAGRGVQASSVHPDTIIAYEPLTNHTTGMNVLFGDGHVEFVDAAKCAAILARVAAQRESTTMPTTR
jgi:prepilin-type processing-associated H-X9-DG protein